MNTTTEERMEMTKERIAEILELLDGDPNAGDGCGCEDCVKQRAIAELAQGAREVLDALEAALARAEGAEELYQSSIPICLGKDVEGKWGRFERAINAITDAKEAEVRS